MTISKFNQKWLIIPVILAVVLIAQIFLMPTVTQSGSTNQKPNLPEIPYDYAIKNLPDHLESVTNSALIAKLNNLTNLNHRASLGRVLFYDRQLSRNNLVSCASCHKQANGFDDPSRLSIGFAGKITRRNAMGLTNALFNRGGKFFWDLRAQNLEQQVLMPFFDAIEMGLNQGELIDRVSRLPYYTSLFTRAFGDAQITRQKIANALTTYVSSIVSTTSTYDKARQKVQNPKQLFPTFSTLQNRGKSLFFINAEDGGGGCINCHQAETFISVPQGSNNGLDQNTLKDQGIGEITALAGDQGKFRPPSLRNIAQRAPFMHDGRFATLDEVIDHYSGAIQNHENLGAALKNKAGKSRRFNFSLRDKYALIEFLETLSDPQLLQDPKFSDPFR